MNTSHNTERIIEAAETIFESKFLESPGFFTVALLDPRSELGLGFKSVLDEDAAPYIEGVKIAKVHADEYRGRATGKWMDFVPTLPCFLNGNERTRVLGLASKQKFLSE